MKRGVSLATAFFASLAIVVPVFIPFLSGSAAASAGEPVTVSEPRWVVPARNLPPEVKVLPSNCNVGIALHEGRLFMAWRTAWFHFASALTRMYVVSSPDMGKTWEFEREIRLGADVREPFLLSIDGRLILTFFEAGTNPVAFEPRRMWRTVRKGPGDWTPLEEWGEPGAVPWAFVIHGGRAWLTTYRGNHYGIEPADIDVKFFSSTDGLDWEPVGGGDGVVYNGGVSEVGFQFDAEGNLWGVTRCEDGDETGFGSHVVFAPAGDLSAWEFPPSCDPNKYDSPRMFRHGEEIYLIARRDPCSPFDMGLSWLPFDVRRIVYLVSYSLRPKRTALYHINRGERKVEWMFDLPGTGDTSFASIVQLSEDRFLVANYTSPLCFKNRTWLVGQIAPAGTRIYFVELKFGS